MNNILNINNISKTYYAKDFEINTLKNINLKVFKDDFISIVGPSGCGKSTLLNIIAGLDTTYSGTICKQDNINIGYMLQVDALLPWLTIKDNCTLGLLLTNKKDNSKVYEVLKKYNLLEFANKYPHELSGGMRQRCALIRTLLTDPDILLLDEPFSALDYQTRLKVEDDVYKIIKNEHKTAILVTHDLEEAIALSSKIIVLSKRPATIKNIHHIKINKNPLDRRTDDNFKKYFNQIWQDLDDV